MHSSRFLFLTGALTVAGLFAQTEQTSGNAPAGSTVVIKTETRLVLVDAVVTDKKGNSVANLAQKDFHVWEDNKEQTVKSFSYEEMAPANSQKRYLILFFDNSTMAPDEQVRARGRGDVHNGERRPESGDGDRRFRRDAPDYPDLHERRGEVEAGSGRAEAVDGLDGGRWSRGNSSSRYAFAGERRGFWRAFESARNAQPGQESGLRAEPKNAHFVHVRL